MAMLIDEPTALRIGADGSLQGSTRTYTKTLGDMVGVYRDGQAHDDLLAAHGPDHVVYTVHEQRYHDGPGAVVVGTSALLPGQVGEEFAVTRGHLHAIADRAELYHCLSGTGVMLLETLDGRSEAVELSAGQAVNVPGHWIHRSVNTGSEPFVTLFCYASDAGQDYGVIERAGGMRQLVVAGAARWTTRANPGHTGYRSADDQADGGVAAR